MSKLKEKNSTVLYIVLGIIIFVALLVLFVFSGDNLALIKSVFIYDLSQEVLEKKFDVIDWHDYVTVIFLAALQVICSFLPAEPVQMLAGLTFGFGEGVLCCIAGVFLGNTAIYLLHKSFRTKLRSFFVKKLHLDIEKIARSSKFTLIIFILYFLPGIPYGMICFFAASTGMRYRRFIAVTTLGSLPSICIGAGLGYMTIVSNRAFSLCVFAALIVMLLVMVWKRDVLFAKLNRYADAHSAAKTVKAPHVNGFAWRILYFFLRIYFFLCGVRVKSVNKVGKPENPAVVLCNHGSFIDFIFAGSLLKKTKPNFVVARLYFYNNILRRLLTTLGAFPKSMFALDTESTKNCIRVLKNGGILTMMPEARLSTTGRFEDIQAGTYSFLKKSGVPVYTIKFGGDYFADPKWGKGFRRGSVVEAELDILFTAEQIQALSVEQIKAGVEARLQYNEFAWLEKHPEIQYRSRRMAEGLENILAVCPVCHQKHTITTKKDKIYCEKCGYLTSLDGRYAFTEDFTFENLTQWYDWQMDLLRKEIAADPDFALTSPVELRLPGNGKGLTRHAGNGTCTLTREGLTYCGTKDGEPVTLQFSLQRIYRLLFGAGVNFELYNGTEILFFVPEEKRSAVDWYMTSMLLHDEFT
ncbi:MAG: VTT domain-containing protein [Oscillospiraceae bacterium]|nr:VTT domain-containing protein [Oscillospiraceae bacterium]